MRESRTKLLVGLAVALVVAAVGVLFVSGDGDRVETVAGEPSAVGTGRNLNSPAVTPDDVGDNNPLQAFVQEVVTGQDGPEGDDESAEATTEGEPETDPATDAEGTADDGDGVDADADTTTTTTEPPTTTAAPAPAPPSTPSAPAPGTGQRILYVDGSSGSDRNPGTEAAPFRRPITATLIAEPGDTIYLRGGTYDTSTHGAFNFRRSGTAENWIRIAPYPGERVELVSGGEWGSAFEVLGASYVEVAGFVMRGRSDSIHGVGVFIKDGAHDVRVMNNQISGFGGGGVSLVEASRVLIEGNEVRDTAARSSFQGSAISLFEPAGPTASGNDFSLVVRGNYVVGNYNGVPHHSSGRVTDGNCIIMDRFDLVGYTGRTLIENNVCIENGGRGVHSYGSSNIVARNNTLYHNMWSPELDSGRGELTAGKGRNIYFYNNLVVNRSGVASFISRDTENTHFIKNWVRSGPPPGDSNRELPGGTIFGSTNPDGPVEQWRPVGSAGLSGTADGANQPSQDLFGQTRPSPGAIGAIEP